jgi:hypothetical protein
MYAPLIFLAGFFVGLVVGMALEWVLALPKEFKR